MSRNKSKHQILLKLKEANKKNYKYDFPDEPIPGLILAKEIDQIGPADMDIIYKRVAEWREQYPNGEPNYKRPAPYRVFIQTKDVMLLYKRSLRWSQVLMQNTRFALEKEKGALLTVTEFCKINGLDAEEIREFLQAVDEADNE